MIRLPSNARQYSFALARARRKSSLGTSIRTMCRDIICGVSPAGGFPAWPIPEPLAPSIQRSGRYGRIQRLRRYAGTCIKNKISEPIRQNRPRERMRRIALARDIPHRERHGAMDFITTSILAFGLPGEFSGQMRSLLFRAKNDEDDYIFQEFAR